MDPSVGAHRSVVLFSLHITGVAYGAREAPEPVQSMAESLLEDSHPDLFLDALEDPLPSIPVEGAGGYADPPCSADKFFDSSPGPSPPSQRNLRRRFSNRRREFQKLSSGDGLDASRNDEAGGIVVDGVNVLRNLRFSESSSCRVDSSAVTGLSKGPLDSEVSVISELNGDDFGARKEFDYDNTASGHELLMDPSLSKDRVVGATGGGDEMSGVSPFKIESSEVSKESDYCKAVVHDHSPVSSLVKGRMEESGDRNTLALDRNMEESSAESLVDVEYTNRVELMEKSSEKLRGSSLDVDNALSPSNSLISLAGFMIKAIGFQLNLFVMFLVFPIRVSCFLYKLVTDPFGCINQIKERGLNVLGQVNYFVWERIGATFIGEPSMKRLAKMLGWGCLWSSYVGFVIFSFFILSFISSGMLMGSFLQEPIRMTKPLIFDYTVSNPVALVPMSHFEGVDYMQYCERNAKVEKSKGHRFIPPYHKLQLTVKLTLPESEYNKKLGVFQVKADFLSANGEILVSSSHPCMLHFKSHPILLAGTFLKSIPLLAGYSSESQTIKVRMTGFAEGIEPSACLRVTLKHRAEYRPGEGIPEIYSASVLIESELPILKRILWSWRRTAFIWVAIGFFVMKLLLILICCRHIIFPRPRPEHDLIDVGQPSIQSIDR